MREGVTANPPLGYTAYHFITSFSVRAKLDLSCVWEVELLMNTMQSCNE